MEDNKDPKWTTTEAINSGKVSLHLLDSYGTELQVRLKTDEQPQHKANVEELETRVSGQKQTLTVQKSSTQAQEEAIHDLNEAIIDIHDIVRNNKASKEIRVAYGVGDRISQSVTGVTAAANVVIDAQLKYAAWSKDAGIIEADITEIKALIKAVNDVGKVQDDSMFVRKAKTMDKNTLQRAVEDEVSRLSAVGARHFSKNPTVRKQFDDLIPAAHKPKPETPSKQTKNANGVSK